MMIARPWVFMLLCVSLPGLDGLTSFPDNFVVGKRDSPVTLSCRTGVSGAVTWQVERDGDREDVEDSEDARVVGRDLVLSELDTPSVGEYSCWDGGRKLGSTYLLLGVEESEDEGPESLISCRAKTYDCSFTCNWTHSEFSAVRLGLGRGCVGEEDSGVECLWVDPSLSSGPEGVFTFELSHSLSPYAEESAALVVTAEAINSHSYLRKTKQFYLRDIVQPDSPEGVRCQQLRDGRLKVTVEPPATWAAPPSYFPLEHEVEYMYKDNGKEERSKSLHIPKKISQLRVRSRDPLVPSSWSEWTQWKNVQTKGKNGGRKGKSNGQNGKAKDGMEHLIRCRTGEKRPKAKSIQTDQSAL